MTEATDIYFDDMVDVIIYSKNNLVGSIRKSGVSAYVKTGYIDNSILSTFLFGNDIRIRQFFRPLESFNEPE